MWKTLKQFSKCNDICRVSDLIFLRTHFANPCGVLFPSSCRYLNGGNVPIVLPGVARLKVRGMSDLA